MIYYTTGLSVPWSLPFISSSFGGGAGTGGGGGGPSPNYTLIRWEGQNATSGTPGSSNSIYELYLFTSSYAELRLGNFSLSGTTSGQYTSGGTGSSFTPVANTSYVWNAASTTTIFNSGYQYINGSLSTGTAAPSLGASAVTSWPPSGWTSLQNASADDANVSVTITSTQFIGTAGRTVAYISSNGYVTFGGSSIAYSGLSTTNPPFDKFMFKSMDASYQRVAYITGFK